MIFKKLSIRNFQGCKKLYVGFNEGITSIIGRNGSGKTTVLDAISWVLFGKDIEGRSQFDIAKIDGEGKVSSRNISVTLTIEQNGTEHVLARSVKLFSVTVCSVDDVPYKVSDYASYVGQLTDGEERFKLYSNPLYFFGLQWKAQRELLMNFFPVPSDEIILSKAEVGSEFKAKLKALTAEQVSLASKAKIKELDRKRDRFIGQVKLLDEYCEYDAGDIGKFEVERGNIRNELVELDHRLKTVDEENEIIYKSQARDTAIRSGLEAIEYSAKERAIRMHNSLISKSADALEEKAKLRKELLSLIRIEGLCPICNQPFTEEMKAKSEKVYQQRSSDIMLKAGIIDEKLAEYQKNIEAIGEFVYTEEDDALIAEYRVELETIRDDNLGEPIDRGNLIKERDALKGREDELNRLLARKDLLEENIAKRTTVKAELLKATVEKESHEQLVKDSDRFIATRTDIVVEQINLKFKTIKVSLFYTQKDGNQVEYFEIRQNGIPFTALNTASQLSVGIELVEFLKESLGIECPILVDNGERYSDMEFSEIKGQVVVATAVKGSRLTVI